jgi:hypothetical protein
VEKGYAYKDEWKLLPCDYRYYRFEGFLQVLVTSVHAFSDKAEHHIRCILGFFLLGLVPRPHVRVRQGICGLVAVVVEPVIGGPEFCVRIEDIAQNVVPKPPVQECAQPF